MKDQLQRTLCIFLSALILFPPHLLADGIRVDQRAPAANRATLDAAQNGVPVVNIARPSGSGLSHNKFSDFNVDSRGVIINNSVRPGVSQLGGALTPNGNLGGRTASAILNEVTGTGRSRLDGYTEIFGAAADYILANPNGISINGGGFINTPSVILSTGRPRFEGGALAGLDVTGGEILVEGAGINADNIDAFTLLTRAAQINADIHAGRLDILTGQNSYNPADGSLVPLDPDGSAAPTVSIDSSALGGMYAGRIRLIGTEKGVGVNLQGLTRATEDIFLQADGHVSVPGTVSADRNLIAASAGGGVTVGGALAAGESAEVTAAGAVRLEGAAGEAPLIYATDLVVKGESLENAGSIMAADSLRTTIDGEAENSGLLQAGSDLALTLGGAARNSGDILAGNGLAMETGSDLDNAGTVHAEGAATLRSGGAVANAGDILAGGDLAVQSGAGLENAGRLQSGGSATVRSADGLVNAGEILALGSVELEAAGGVDNTGMVGSEAGVSIEALNLGNSGVVDAGGALRVDVSGALDNTGILFSGADAALEAGGVVNGPGGEVSSLGDLAVTVGADFVNAGNIAAGGAFSVGTGGGLVNTGEILAQAGIHAQCAGSFANAGLFHSGGSGQFHVGSFMDNSGSILGVGDLIFDVTDQSWNSGEIRAGGDVRLILAGSLWNTGTVLSQGSLLAELPGDIDNDGVLAGGANTELRLGGGLFNHASGQVLAEEDLTLKAGTLLENIGLLHAGASLSAEVAGDVVNAGEMAGQAGLSVNSGASVGNEGLLHSGGTAAVRAAADLSNAGDILSKGDLAVSAGGVFTNTGRVATESDADVRAGNLLNAGELESGGSLTVDVAEVFENPGRLFSGETLEILAGSVRNLVSGLMMSMGDLWADAGAGLRNAGDMVAGGFLSVTTGADLRNEGGILAQSGIAVAASGHVDNPGTVRSGGGLSVRSGASLFNSGEFQAVGDTAFGIARDVTNTGVLLIGGAGMVEAGGGLSNHGSVLAHSSLHIDAAGDVDNAGTLACEGGLSLLSDAGLRNSGEGRLLSGGDMVLSVDGDLFNQGLLEACGLGAVTAGGDFFNEGGRMLSQDGLAFDLAGAAANTGVLHSGAGLAFRSAGLENDGDILAQGDSWLTIAGNLLNTGFLFTGGAADLGVAGELHNDRGQILSVGDMRLGGATLGSSMEGLLNEAGTVETLEGSMSIRARVVCNVNPDLVVTEGTEVVSLQGGRYSFFSDNWDQAQDLYEMLPSSSLVPSKRDAIIIIPAELQVLGLGLDRNAFPRAELDAAIAAAEARFAFSGGTDEEIAIVASLKKRLNNKNIQVAIQHFKDRSKVAAYVESVTRDTATGSENGATLAAAVDLEVLADFFENYASTVSTASGDISIDAASFSNTGTELYEHRTIEWARGHANEHNSPRLAKEGGGVEVVDTPVGHAYGTISAGGSVVITADHVSNGISGDAGLPVGAGADIVYAGGVGSLEPVTAPSAPDAVALAVADPGAVPGSQVSVIAPPRPEDLSPTLANLDELIKVIPANGLFSVNAAPGHRYLIETNPALTGMSNFYGSDYFLDRLDVDLARTQQQLLGDAFYETRLVREQIFALTGRRLLSSEFTSDAEQMRAFLDNAVAAHQSLELCIGISLTAEQVAALDADIVWLETRVVNGHEVLVPVVYLCSGSMGTIARGGSVIYGQDVDIRTTGDTANAGVIQALGDLAISARNIFNSFGTIQGGSVDLSAAGSIRNTSGLVQGGDVSLSAGQDIVSDTAVTTFSQSETRRRMYAYRGPVLRNPGPLAFGPTTTSQTTSETVGRRGSIEATGDLSMKAGNDIGIVGSDVRAGGDISMEAGGDAVVTAQTLESRSKARTGSSRSRFDTLTSKASTVEAGGSVSIAADGNVVVQGSTVTAGEDARVAAGGDVAVIAAGEGYDYRFKQESSGGLFGTSRSESMRASVSSSLAAVLGAGNRVVIEAGKNGMGDVTVVGSRIESAGDMDIAARDGILIASVPERRSEASASSESSLFSGKAEASGESRVTQAGSLVVAGNDLRAEAKNVAVSASQVHAGRDAEIASTESDVIVSGAQNTESAFSFSKKEGWDLSELLDLPLAILGFDDVEIYSSRAEEAKNTASLNTGSAVSAGNNLEIDSARDIAVIGSAVAAGNNVELNAARDANLISGLTELAQEKRVEKESIGFSVSWSENEVKAFAGLTRSETGSSFTGDYNAGSLVSAGNDVGISAGNNVNQYTSDVEAGRDVQFRAGNDINVGANADVEHMEQYAREIQIGVTASARQSVTTAVRTLADTPENIASGQGSDAAKGITAASSILRGVSAVQQLTNVGASVSATVGASGSQSSASMDAADAVSSSVRAGRDVGLDADRDVEIEGSEVLALGKVVIRSGRDVGISSATSSYSAGSDTSRFFGRNRYRGEYRCTKRSGRGHPGDGRSRWNHEQVQGSDPRQFARSRRGRAFHRIRRGYDSCRGQSGGPGCRHECGRRSGRAERTGQTVRGGFQLERGRLGYHRLRRFRGRERGHGQELGGLGLGEQADLDHRPGRSRYPHRREHPRRGRGHRRRKRQPPAGHGYPDLQGHRGQGHLQGFPGKPVRFLL